jgi:hypothetical protein
VHNNANSAPSIVKNSAHPGEIFRQLTATMWQILDELLFLEECRKRRAPGMAVYTTPSTYYLAGKCGVSRYTISRNTQLLVALGVLHKRFRRAVGGKFQTCLYVVNNKYKWRINKVKQAISAVTSRVRKSAHKQAKAIEISKPNVAIAPKRTKPPPEWQRLREKLRGGDLK